MWPGVVPVLKALALAVSLVLLAACGSAGDGPAVTGLTTSDDDGYHGILLDEAYAVPDVPLTDTEGRPFDLAKQPRRTLVFFGYTNCPDICQVVMSTIASAMARLPAEQREQLHVPVREVRPVGAEEQQPVVVSPLGRKG